MNPYAPSLVAPQQPVLVRQSGISASFPQLTVVRQLAVPAWDKLVAEQALAFWSQRGFADAAIQPGLEIVGSRGSWLGNFTSYDMSRLKTSLCVQPAANDRLHVRLEINTFGQQITEWNRAYWRLELIDFKRFLRGEKDIASLWARFHAGDRRASVKWTLSLGLFGQYLPDDLETEICTLECDAGEYRSW
jgi:hypothetical protein